MADDTGESSRKIHEIYLTKTNQSKELVEQIPGQVVNEQLNDVLESVVHLDKLCQYKKCKQRVNLIGFPCKHCEATYCVKHNLPEVCKSKEQKEFRARSKPEVKAAKKKDELQKSLAAKLDKMQLSRKPKPKK